MTDTDPPPDTEPDDAAPLPDAVIDDAERLTRLTRQAAADDEEVGIVRHTENTRRADGAEGFSRASGGAVQSNGDGRRWNQRRPFRSQFTES